jgi:glycosyltransferase involved in cell wall biosynthesis
VASDLGGNRDLIEDAVSGLLVPAGDEEALASALIRVFTDTSLAQRLADGGFAHVQRFSMRTHHSALVSLYQAVLDECG